jgi:GMP synthase-like glutamine amidotransferase
LANLMHTNSFYKYVKHHIMHLAILATNTDDSAFAKAHPHDGDKWRALLGAVRPEWAFTVFDVTKGQFPPQQSRFDGWIIGGSPASVHDADVWVGRLMRLIRQITGLGQPMFGACFGHQAIAQALGGVVGKNPQGWKLGLAEMTDGRGVVTKQYAAHTEQVTALPKGASVVASSAHCPIASFAIGPAVLTTQYHPEMTHGFIVGLVEHLAHDLPAQVIAQARNDLQGFADSAASAQQIVTFFEHQAKAASKSMAVT